MRETEIRDGVEKYQLGVTRHWVESHPVPELHRGMKFYSTMYPSPCFIIEGNDPEEQERHPTHIPGGVPDREERGEQWLLHFPSSGSDPLRWLPGEYIREQFQCGQYKLEPTKMAKDRGMDSEAWWQPIIEEDMEDEEDQPYDFINVSNHDKGGEEDNGLLQYISTIVKQLV